MPWLTSANKPQRASGKRNAQPETVLQMACVKLLRTLQGTLFFSVPNHIGYGGKNSGARIGYMAKQKAMGLLPGCSDLVIIFRNIHGATTLCLPELKSNKGVMSEHQASFADRANNLGCYTGVIYSLDDLTSLLRAAGHCSFRS